MDIDQGGVRYIFYWAGSEPPAAESARQQLVGLGFGSSQQTLAFLRRFRDASGFRTLLQAKYPGQNYVWKAENVLEKLADELIRKRLLVVKLWIPAESSPPAAGAGTVMPRRNAQPISESSEPATFPANHDEDTQAQALANASENGAPFCEECAKTA